MNQGLLLTQEDLAHISENDVRSVRKDIKELKAEWLMVPTRGQQKDIVLDFFLRVISYVCVHLVLCLIICFHERFLLD